MLIADVSTDWALTLPGPTPNTPIRSPGIHVSDLVRAAAVDLALLDPNDIYAGFDQPSVNRMCAGLAWEEWLAKQYSPGLLFHPGEVSRDGVSGSPDARSHDFNTTSWNKVVILHEFKFTWKSSNTPVSRHWYWLSQLQAYLCCVNQRVGMLHVYHVNGDYRGSGPIYRVHKLEFSPVELEENWRLLLKYRPQVEAELLRKEQWKCQTQTLNP